LEDSVKVFYRHEVGAARAEGARSRWNDLDAFGSRPTDDTKSNGAIALDCVDSSVVLVGYPDLAAEEPEA
jgi:hypothetical protein